MVYKYKRYLANTNTGEVHDTARETPQCQLDDIRADHRRWVDTLAEAYLAGFDDCGHCLDNSRR